MKKKLAIGLMGTGITLVSSILVVVVLKVKKNAERELLKDNMRRMIIDWKADNKEKLEDNEA